MLNKFVGHLMLAIAALCLTACRTIWVEPNEGSAVNAAIRSQSVNRDSTPNANKSIGGLDGVAAKASIDNYNRSFILPAGGAGGASGAAAASQPATTTPSSP